MEFKIELKQKLKSFLKVAAVVIVSTLFFASVTYAADDGAEFELFYDFENYNATYSDKKLPDTEYWDWRAENNRNVASYKEDSSNNVLKLAPWHSSVLFFNRLATSGKMHISFDVKMSTDKIKTLFILEDGSQRTGKGDDLHDSGMSANGYSRLMYLRGRTGDVEYNKDKNNDETYPGNLTIGWNYYKAENLNFDFTQWHRIDIVTTEMSKSDARIQYYIDGQAVLPKPLYFATSAGFKGLNIYVTAEKDDNDQEYTLDINKDFLMVDNISVKRYFDETGLRGTTEGSGKVELENGEAVIRLTERVQSSLLTSDNITVVGGVDQKTVTNFTVEPLTDSITTAADDGLTDRFKIKFTGSIDMGSYKLTLSDKVKGKYLNLSMVTPITFRTAPKIKNVTANYLTDAFDDYTEQNTLPSGWNYLPSQDNVAKSVVGKENTTALGIENAPKRQTGRIVRAFNTPVSAGNEYLVNFDIKSEGANWFLYLAEKDDLSDTTSGYDQNIALYGSGSNLKYAKTRTSQTKDLANVSGVILNADDWNNVKLKVVPQSSKVLYKISVNGGEEVTVETERDFKNSATYGLGFGYLPSGDASLLTIDNVSVSSSIAAVYPEVENIEFINSDGEAVASDNGITSTVSSIKVNFNTFVDAETAKSKIILGSDEAATPYNIRVTETDEGSCAMINFPELLSADTNYNLKIGMGIPSKYTKDVSSLAATSKSFKTYDDASFKVSENKLENGEDGKYVYSLKIVKNTDDSANISALVAAYEKEAISDKTYDKLTDIKYIPIEISADTKGVFEYTAEITASDSAEVKSMLWKWKGNQKLKLSSGTIGEITID